MLVSTSDPSLITARAQVSRGNLVGAGSASWMQVQCWILAVALSVITISGYGLLQPIRATHVFAAEAEVAQSVELEVLTMMDLAAPEGMQDDAVAEEDSAELVPVEALLEQMQTPPVLDPALDLAQPVTPFVDLFEVPAAMDFIEPETLKQPTPPKPVARPAPRPSATPAAPARASSGGVPGGTTAGASNTGRTVAKGYFPAPPYPASARSRRLEGTVQIRVTFGADGRVTSAVVTRSSGYTELDRGASDWVLRRWRGPSGQPGTAQQVIRFKLL